MTISKKQNLHQQYIEHKGKLSDKWSLYLKEWDRLLPPYREQPISLLEIGIQNGGSLEIWSKYFPRAEVIVGCDIDEKCKDIKYDDPRIVLIIGDANSDDCESQVLEQATGYDVIIDDGSHNSSDIVRSFIRYFKYLQEGGIYLVEDIHCSYWQDFEGGLNNPLSAMAFFKRLADVLNYEHWRNNKPRNSILNEFASSFDLQIDSFQLAAIHSIEFLNSLIIIKKASPDKNILGKRIVSGTDERVTTRAKWLNATSIHDIPVTIVDDSHLDVFELIKSVHTYEEETKQQEQQVVALAAQLAEQEQKVHLLDATIVERDQKIQSLHVAIDESEKTIRSLQSKATERNQVINSLSKTRNSLQLELSSLKVHLGQREQILQDLNTKLLDIYSSTAWKLVRWMWIFRLWLVPHGSKRERLGRFLSYRFHLKSQVPEVSRTRSAEQEQNRESSSKSVDKTNTISGHRGGVEKSSSPSMHQENTPKQVVNSDGDNFTVYGDLLSVAQGGKGREYVDISDSDLSQETLPVNMIAFYLPQFHPIPENDAWWGKGFTEWTNVSKAVPQFEGHYQPHLPGELGFYDLRVVDVQRRQVELAKKYGLRGFCFYYYWFDGKRLLEKPLDQYISDPEIDFPFCLCWANENWTRRWDGKEEDVIIAQTHSVDSNYRFIRDLAPYLKNQNYIRIDGRPVLLVYQVNILEDPLETTQQWREYAIAEGIGDLYLIAMHVFGFQGDPATIGFDAALEFPPNTLPLTDSTQQVKILNPEFKGKVFDYNELVKGMIAYEFDDYKLFKTVMPSWDNTARKPNNSSVFINSSPERFQFWLSESIRYTKRKFSPSERYVFINAWNEWAEGTHLEPDRKFGYAYLQAVSNSLGSIITDKRRNGWKILFISHDANRGGAQNLLLNILRWYKQHTSVQIRVLCLEGGQLLSEFDEITNTLVFSSISDLSQDEQLERLLNYCEGKPDLIYGNTVVSGKIYPLLSNIDAPILTHVHELNSSIDRYASDCIDDVLRFSQAFIACSQAVKNNLVQRFQIPPDKCTVAYSFVEPSGIEPPVKQDEKTRLRKKLGLDQEKFLVMGGGIGMPFRKGADLFIETALEMRRRGDINFHFYWIGGFDEGETDPQWGDWADSLRKVKAERLQEYITFLGLKDNPMDYMRAGDVFFLSSRDEPFALMMMEAADCNLPIICFADGGGAPELVSDDAGFVVPFADVTTVADRVEFLMENEEIRFALGAKAKQKFLEGLTSDRVVPQILSLTRKVAKQTPAVSVIVPNYNHARYLPARLDSIFTQTFRDVEVFLLDDASSDGSVEILHLYADNYPDVFTIVNKQNSGSPFKQWLAVLPMVKGDIVWIAESDDLCEPDLLEKLLPAFDDTDVKLAYCASYVIDDQGNVHGQYSDMDYLKSISPTRWKQSYCVPADVEVNQALGIKNTILNISSVLFRKFEMGAEFKQTLAGMHIGGDAYLILNAILNGKVYYEATPLNYHRRHSSSIVGKVLTEQNEVRLQNFFKDFYDNLIFTARHYQLLPDFQGKLDKYIRELWSTLAPNEPNDRIYEFFPVDEIMNEINGSRGEPVAATQVTNGKFYGYDSVLMRIDGEIPAASPQEIPRIFTDIPLEVFGLLTLQKQNHFPNIKSFLPSMPEDYIQQNWTGSSGEILLDQSVAFIDTVVQAAKNEFCLDDLSNLKLLDFGCGWGRLLRLFYKYFPTTNLYAVDAWETSLQHCQKSGVRANYAQIGDVCTGIPFDEKFDLIISFSVFTHLSKRSGDAALKAIRRSMRDDGLLVITVRPVEYLGFFFSQQNISGSVEYLEKLFYKDGFVFLPHNREPVNGEVTYGDTFISEKYISDNWQDWRVIESKINPIDPYQKVVILKPQ